MNHKIGVQNPKTQLKMNQKIRLSSQLNDTNECHNLLVLCQHFELLCWRHFIVTVDHKWWPYKYKNITFLFICLALVMFKSHIRTEPKSVQKLLYYVDKIGQWRTTIYAEGLRFNVKYPFWWHISFDSCKSNKITHFDIIRNSMNWHWLKFVRRLNNIRYFVQMTTFRDN